MSTALHDQLQSLHQQLSTLERIDPATQQQLLVLLADISRLLERSEVEQREHSPAEAVETLAARFDADHPALSSALRNLIDTLGKAGI